MLNSNIKRLRQLRGLSQVKLAKQLNVSKQCISNWENDNIQPSIEMLVKIAMFFNTSTDELLDLSKQKMICVDGLTDSQIEHLKMIVNDLTLANSKKNI